MATIKMPIRAIQLLFPACISREIDGTGVLVGGPGVMVALGGLAVRVPVTAGLSFTAVDVKLKIGCSEADIAMFDSANSKKRTKIAGI